MNKDYQALVVSHTHWDREWYMPFQKTRAKLISVLDEILETLSKDERFRSFTLDGQTAILQDYLEIKPERKEDIKRLVEEGRLFIGPWYIQMDEFLEGDEALVRNLMMGIKIAAELGGAMLVGYVPDSFGHIAQLPQLLRGFGVDSFIFTRGMGDNGENLKTEFRWLAPDRSEVIAVHLLKGYCNADLEMARFVGVSREKIRENPREALVLFERLKSELLPKASTDWILLMNGCDFRSIQPEIPDIIQAWNELFKREVIKQGSLVDYVKKIKESNIKLDVYRGELRGARYHPILTNVFSSRIYLKQENVSAQTLLQYYAEPLATYAWVLGHSYPSGLLLKAWKYLIQNQAHDSICGTCVDEAHRENFLRFLWVKQIAESVIEDSLKFLASRIKSANMEASSAILVYNPLNWQRSEVVEAKISKPTTEHFEIKDSTGKSVPFQIVKSELDKIDLILMAEDIPPCGYKTFFIVRSEGPLEFPSTLRCGENELENEFFKTKLDPEKGGSLTIFDKRCVCNYENMNILEDDGDAGDEYYFSPVSPLVSSAGLKASVKTIEKGPVRATLRVKFDFALPKELDEGRNRSKETVACPITMNISMYPKVPRVDIRGDIYNRAKDHRLRAIFPTGFKIEDVKHSFAHDQFYVVKRPIIPPKGENWVDHPPTTHPHRFFVDVNDGASGLMVSNKGLPEYEIIERGGLQIALTLLRCTGWLSRGKAGPVIPTPEAQCLGANRFEYSIIPHDENWLKSGAYKEAYNFNLPLMAFEVKLRNKGDLPPEASFVGVDPDKLVLTAVKKSEDGCATVIRFYNISDRKLSCAVRMFPTKNLWVTDLREKPLFKVEPRDGLRINVDPHKIVTLKAEFFDKASNIDNKDYLSRPPQYSRLVST